MLWGFNSFVLVCIFPPCTQLFHLHRFYYLFVESSCASFTDDDYDDVYILLGSPSITRQFGFWDMTERKNREKARKSIITCAHTHTHARARRIHIHVHDHTIRRDTSVVLVCAHFHFSRSFSFFFLFFSPVYPPATEDARTVCKLERGRKK